MTDPTWIHLGIEAAKLAMADRDLHLTDPEFADIPVAHLLDPAHAADLARIIDPHRAALPPASTNPAGGGTIYLAAVDADGNAVSLIESNYMGFGSGVVDPATGIHYQNRGSYFSLDDEHPNRLAPGKRTLHTLLPGMLFRDGAAGPWVVAGSMGGDAQPQIHAQLVSAMVDGGVDVRTAVSAPRWFVEPAGHFQPPVDVRLEPRHVAGVERGAGGHGPPAAPDRRLRLRPRPRACDRARRRRSGGARWVGGRGDGPAQRGAACRLVGRCRSEPGAGALPSPAQARPASCSRRRLCDTRRSGGGLRSHDAATGPVVRHAAEGARDLERQPELPLHERIRG